MSVVVLVGGVSILSFVLTDLVRQYALRRAMVDEPGARSSHSAATPRGGGAAILLAFLAALVGAIYLVGVAPKVWLALVVGGSAVAAVGFWDDHGGVRASVRLVVHVAAGAGVVVLLGGMPEFLVGAWSLHWGWFGAGIATLGIVWLLNLFNFMDGIDALAAAEAVFVALAGAGLLWWAGEVSLAIASLLLAAATLGFLVWNLPPARIFMGDVGSGFLGFALGVLGLAAAHAVPQALWAWVILLGLFIVDATVTLLVRLHRGTRWNEPHRRHAYQRLAHRWGSHGRVTALYTGINVLWLLPWAVVAWLFPAWGSLIVVVALAPLVWWVWILGAGEPMDDVPAA